MTNHSELISEPSVTREILKKHGFTFKKSLGQNFLTNPALLEQMVSAANLTPEDQVLEIGPGIGALTQLLAQRAQKVVALEIDQRLLPILADTLAAYDNVTVRNQDVLKVALPEFLATEFDLNRPIKVLANLPYYITTPILLKLIAATDELAEIIVMMQYEVAQRLIAEPGHKTYGSLSVAVQMNMDAEIAVKVPKTAFIPQPKVDSAIVRLTALKDPLIPAADKLAFNNFVQIVFKQRRKRLLNNLIQHFGGGSEAKQKFSDCLAKVDLSPDIRAEALSITELYGLFTILLKDGYKLI
ncbi:16S rRNA (adenine(1518)-N(6)/adenine(1519)-N(6))-dimethyltransferase RsmA [Agrilactobacillus yilanensis]|uniref:Ribosomal RNA small subunit methyltransferase A n=1 Tax=Agrilactobacillus yilanensis TaxID=2485997 RepID=A0ABW4J3Q7_9LACO|nr:16S rRNA (adenine(1518)-N(6)/adenine(1519)-N(6))-dimethyltransferase RsmA [Agrilactobacillus yilanensis]